MNVRYRIPGIALMLVGLALASSYLLLHSTLLATFGLYPIIIGLSCIFLAGASDSIRAQDCRKLNSRNADARFLIWLGVALGIIDVSFTILNLQDITVYFIAYSLAFLLVAQLCVGLPTKSRARLYTLGSFIFVAFLAVLAFKIAQITKQI